MKKTELILYDYFEHDDISQRTALFRLSYINIFIAT